MKGTQKNVTDIKLNEYVPIKDSACIVSADQDHVYEIKFQGNPLNIFPLKNSDNEKISEKNITKKIFFSTKGPAIKIAKPKKRDKNNGIKTRAKGIKPINISS